MILPLAAIISRIASSKPRAMGNIMAAVAVLLIQPEQSIQAKPMARKMRRGESPTHFIDMMPYAIRLSRPFTIIPFAIKKPPMNRKIIGLAKFANASFTGTTPKITQSVGPRSEVTGMGTGSQIHQNATNVTIASNLCASGLSASPAIGINQTHRAQRGPMIAPKIWRFRSNAASFALYSAAEFVFSVSIRIIFYSL